MGLLRSAEFVKKVCDAVGTEGATPHVAAFARGLSLKDFWLVWGVGLQAQEKKDADEQEKLLADFVHQVQVALAKARLDAEKRVFKRSPHIYLGSSPACTGGSRWKRKNGEPLSPEELFQLSGAWYLRYGEACTSGAYSLDPVPPGPPEYEPPCPQCEEAARQKRVEFVNEILRRVDEKKAREKAEESTPHPSASGALPSPHPRRGDEKSELPLSVDTERGLGGEVCSPQGKTGPGP